MEIEGTRAKTDHNTPRPHSFQVVMQAQRGAYFSITEIACHALYRILHALPVLTNRYI